MFVWLQKLFTPQPVKRLEVVCVSYATGDQMLLQKVGWEISPIEDHNKRIGMVYLEREVL